MSGEPPRPAVLMDALRRVMADGGWWTAPQLAARVGRPPNQVGNGLGGLYAKNEVHRRLAPGASRVWQWTAAEK